MGSFLVLTVEGGRYHLTTNWKLEKNTVHSLVLALGGSKMESFTGVFWGESQNSESKRTRGAEFESKKKGKFFQVFFYDQNFIGRLVKLLDLINISPNSDVTKGVLARKPEPYIYIGDLTKIQRKPERSYSSKNTQRLLLVNFFLDVLGSLREFLLTHIKVEGFLFQLRPPLRNTKNWVNLHQKIRQKGKTCRLPKAPVFGIPCCQ